MMRPRSMIASAALAAVASMLSDGLVGATLAIGAIVLALLLLTHTTTTPNKGDDA